MLVDVGGLGLARMPFSVNSQAIVSAGRLRFFRDDMLTDLRNWEMGERNSEQMSDNWSPDYRMGAYARIPVFMPADGAGITAEVTLTDNQAKQWVFGSDTTNADEAGIFVENGAFFVQLNTSATAVNIGAAIVGNNTLTYSNTSAAFNPGISLFGAQRINSTLGEFLTGRIFNVRLSDTDMPENSRAYSSVIREAMPTEGDRNANRPTDLHILDSLNTPNTLASMGTVEVIGGAMGSPAVSGEILATGQLTVGNFYSVNCSVATDGMAASGWSAVNGIPSRAMVTGAGSVFEVFRAVSNNVILTLFTENTAATFTNIRVQEVTHGLLLSFPDPVWSIESTEPTTPDIPGTDFDLGTVIDAVRNRGRYIWIRENSGMFGVTDLQNEQRPDYIAPFYSAEAEPDRNIAVDAWKGYVVIFGRYTIEYFGLTGNPNQIYAPVQSLTVRAGIVGLGCKSQYLDSFAIIGGPEFEAPSIYLIGQGTYREIATRRIQKILRSYTIEEIERATYMEPVKFDAHDFLVIHLPDDVLIYDHNASGEGNFAWSVLKSDIRGNNPYRGIYHVNNGNQWTAADKQQSILSRFSYDDARHIGQEVEYIVNTPMVQVRNRRVYDLQIDSVPGRTNTSRGLGYSVTLDGITYGQEHFIPFDSPRDYTRRILARRLGYVRNNVGFRLRWTTDTPSAISDFRVRIE